MKKYVDMTITERTEWLKQVNSVVNHMMPENSHFVIVFLHHIGDEKEEDGHFPIVVSSIGSLPTERIPDLLHSHACEIQGHFDGCDEDDEDSVLEEGEEWKRQDPERN